MPVTSFPPVEAALESGLLAVGGDLHPDSLILAYRSGIFPWPLLELEGGEIPWFSPPNRALLFFSELHVTRKLRKTYEKNNYQFKFNAAFAEVVRACAEVRKN